MSDDYERGKTGKQTNRKVAQKVDQATRLNCLKSKTELRDR